MYSCIQVFKYSSIQVLHITYNVKSRDPIGSKNVTAVNCGREGDVRTISQ